MQTTRTFKLGNKTMPPMPSPGWDFFRAQEVGEDEREVLVAVRKGRADIGSSIDADNIREDKAHGIYFLRDARPFGATKVTAVPPTGTSKKQKRLRAVANTPADRSGKKKKAA